jgi:hypothetical protein
MLCVAASWVSSKEDVLFLAVHFLLLQRGWVAVDDSDDTAKTEQNTTPRGIETLLPPHWCSTTPKNGSFVTTYRDTQQRVVTISSLRVDEQVIVHLHTEGGSETLSAELRIIDTVSTLETWIVDLRLHSVGNIRNILERSLFASATTTTTGTDTAVKKKRRSSKSTSSLTAQQASANQRERERDRQREEEQRRRRGNPDFGFDQDLHPSFGGGFMGGVGGGSMVGPMHPGFGLHPQHPQHPTPGIPARFSPFGPGVPGVGGGGVGTGESGPTPDHLPPPRPDWMYQ